MDAVLPDVMMNVLDMPNERMKEKSELAAHMMTIMHNNGCVHSVSTELMTISIGLFHPENHQYAASHIRPAAEFCKRFTPEHMQQMMRLCKLDPVMEASKEGNSQQVCVEAVRQMQDIAQNPLGTSIGMFQPHIFSAVLTFAELSDQEKE